MKTIDYKRIYNKNRDGWKEATSEGNHKFDQLFAGQYSENNHFIYELLQNAEDAGATFIAFVYQADRLTVYHDGRPFTEADVKAICSVMDGTKDKNDAQTIGHFGFGFKSVFKYTDRPEVYSDQEAFAIERYLLPVEISPGDFPRDCEYRMGDQVIRPFEKKEHCTKFVLPFKARLENAGIDPRDITQKLAELETEILLFLKHVKTLTWIDETTGDHGEYKRIPEKKDTPGAQPSGFGQICRCQKKQWIDDEENSANLRYLIYEDVFPLMEMSSACVKVAFKFQKSAISPADSAQIWVFFPTTDGSGLRFLVHGTYQTPISREKIITDSSFNRELLCRTEDLVIKALPDLCAKGLMSQVFLRDVLLPSFDASLFPQLREKATTAFQQEALLPAVEKEGYYRSDELRLPVPYEMTGIIHAWQIVSMGGPDLNFVVFNDANGTGSTVYYRWLKDDLGIQLWTISDFADLISQENAEKFDEGTSVLAPLSEIFSEYFQRSSRNPDYSRDLERSRDFALEILKRVVMVPNRAGGLSAAWVDDSEHLFFPDANMPSPPDEQCVSLEKIDEEKRDDVEKFLKNRLGIQVYSHEQYVKMYILPKYERRPISVSDDEHIQDIRQMEKCGSWICGYMIIRAKDYEGNDFFCTPRREGLYFETDSDGNSIKDYLEDLSGDYLFVDMEFYSSHGVSRNDLRQFSVSENLLVNESETSGEYYAGNPGRQPDWNTYGEFRWKLSMKKLDDALIYISRHPDSANAKEKSKVIFHILQKKAHRLVGTVYIGGNRVANKTNEPAEIIQQLRPDIYPNRRVQYYDTKSGRYVQWNGKWLYTKPGKLVSPAEITKRELDTELYGSVSMDSPLYDLLGFKKDEVDLIEDKLKEYDKLPLEKQETYFESALFRKYGMTAGDLDKILALKTTKPSFEFPSQSIRDLERLRRHVNDQFACSSPVRYKMLYRSVRITSNDGRAYLRDQYEADGKHACQLCHQPKLRFEAVQISEDPKWELDQMYLSLCPDCAETYRAIRRSKSSMSALKARILSWDETQPQSGPVKLPVGKDGSSLWFSPVHLAEVKLLLRLLEKEETSQTPPEE